MAPSAPVMTWFRPFEVPTQIRPCASSNKEATLSSARDAGLPAWCRRWRNLPLLVSSRSRPPPLHSEPIHTRPSRSSRITVVLLTLRLSGSAALLGYSFQVPPAMS